MLYTKWFGLIIHHQSDKSIKPKKYIYCIIAHSGKFSVSGHLTNSCPSALGSILSLALVVSFFFVCLVKFLKKIFLCPTFSLKSFDRVFCHSWIVSTVVFVAAFFATHCIHHHDFCCSSLLMLVSPVNQL